ncbi:MAG TPA: efflux RND transporter periplasmic adaptor subunit [Hyphomicrobiaceae bacterium]|nr:efflux RND transporter periplasmic adaptor subunit [Hyphomicrobiaceae bacterium]
MSAHGTGASDPATALSTGTRKWRSVRRQAFIRVAVLAIAAAAVGCKSDATVGEKEVVRPVKVASVVAAAQGRTLTYSGAVRPRIESSIGFRVGGKIVQRAVNAGDRVKVGQLVARLDDTDLKLAERGARAAVVSARTRREVAGINVDRAKPLLPQGYISRAAYDVRRSEHDAAISALDTAEAQLRQATNAVGYATLTADKAGVVTAVLAEPGQVVSAGQPVIAIAEAGAVEVAIAVPEQDAGRIAVGQPARVALWAGPDTGAAGRIREIAGQADAASRTYAVRVALPDPPEGTRLGMTATVALHIDGGEDAALQVPLTALTESDGVSVVFVVDTGKSTVRRTPVTVVGIVDDGVRVTGGLTAGELVVTGGVQFLRDGMRVRIPAERPGRSS